MGALCSGPKVPEEEQAQYKYEKKMTMVIDAAMQKDQKDDERLLKLLLLGTGESGKSTLFKQLIHIYREKDFSPAERLPFASIVHTNCVVSMKTLCKQSDRLAETHPELGTVTSEAVAPSKLYMLSEVKADGEVNETVAEHIARLWEDEGIRNTFNARNYFQLTDSCRYFFNKIKEVGQKGYVPTYSDILQCRARTSGIVETLFQIGDNKFKMVDVGGQRNERKKWIHCFDTVTAVIFVAAINEYDQVLYEDSQTNRVVEALELFQEICNSRWFRETSMILFLNKRDLFQEKFERGVDMRSLFEDYEGGFDVEAGIEFLTQKFAERNQVHSKRLYVHATCATDTDNVHFTFEAVKDIIVQTKLKEIGLID